MAAKPKVTPYKAPGDQFPGWKQQAATYIHGRSHLDTADALAVEMERKWGAGRLRLLVELELRVKFDSQRMKLDTAIRSGELEDVIRESGRMVNAWRALDAAATAAGAPLLSPLVWEIALPDGRVAALVRSNEDARAVIADGRHVEVYTMGEIAHLIDGFPAVVKAKQTFPGAEVVRVRPLSDPVADWVEGGDEIPFGA